MRTYTPQEFKEALSTGQRTAAGMLYTTFVAGKKTTGVVLFKETHHTSQDTQLSKRELTGRSRMQIAIETKVAERSGPSPAG